MRLRGGLIQKSFAHLGALGFTLVLSPLHLQPLRADHNLRELSAGFVPDGVVSSALPSPDGKWLAFDGCEADVCWLASAQRYATAGAPPIVLDGPYGFDSLLDYRISGDSRRLVYQAPTGPGDRRELWSVPLDGSAAPIRLHAPLGTEYLREFVLTPDGSQVVFEISDGSGIGTLQYAPTDGSAAPFTLDEGNVDEMLLFTGPNGNDRVLYLIDTDNNQRVEVWTAYLGSSPPFRLWAGELLENFNLRDWAVAPDGLRAALLGDLFAAGITELASIRLDSENTFLRLNQNLASGGEVERFLIADDGTVVFRADALVNNVQELWSAPIDASSTPVKLSGTLVTGGDVTNPRLAGDRVVYLADATVDGRTELWSAPIDGSAAPSRRSDTVPAGRSVHSFRIADNGSRIVYRANLEALDRYDLYRTSVTGSATHLRLTNLNPLVLFRFDVGGFAISPDSLRVAFSIRPDANFDGQVREQSLLFPQNNGELLVNAEGVDSQYLSPRYLDPSGILFRAGLEPGDRAEVLLADLSVFADGFESGNRAAWSASVP